MTLGFASAPVPLRERDSGAYCQQRWSVEVVSSPGMILLADFNKWMDGSMVELSPTFGNMYLGLTVQMAVAYKAMGFLRRLCPAWEAPCWS